MTIIPSVDAQARAAAAAAASKADALRAELVANGTLTAAGGTPAAAPLPAITTTTTNATFIAGATTGTVAVLSAVPAGATRTLLPNDGRLALNSAGTAIVVGLSASAAGTINATVKDSKSGSADSPPLNVPVTVTAAAVTPNPTPTPTPVNGSILTTFGFRNYMAAPSPGLWRQGIVFRPGQVPAGSSVQVQFGGQPVAAQFDERVTRADGSLAYAVMHGRHTDYAAGETRSYDVRLAAGVPFDNGSTGTLAAITGAHDFKVTFANLTETGNAGATPVGSGGFQASFNAHMAVATRREKHHSGAVCDGWTGWGMAADAAGGAADAHLQTIWHGDVWKNADGSTYAVEIAAEPAQHWWSIGAKKLRSYDAALLDGGATIASYPGVQHHYHSRNLTVQNGGNNTRGKRHWVGGAQPTLTYLPNRADWIASGMMPPLDLTKPCNPLDPGPSYIPGSGQGDRTDIDGTGAHPGRGVVTHAACAAFLRQTAEDYASARMSALAALHIPYHRRSNRTRTRPGDAGPDTANTVPALVMGISGGSVQAPPYDFTAQGMPTPVHAYYDHRTAPAFMDGFVPADGGIGPWTEQTGDSSHAENIAYGMYLLEGERYLLEATLDLAMNCIQEQIGLEYWGRPYLFKNGVQDTSVIYDAVGQANGQERSVAWCMNNVASAAGIVPDGHPAAGHMRRLSKQQALYFGATVPDKALVPDLYAVGVSPAKEMDPSGVTCPWMGSFNAMAAFHAYRLTGEQGFYDWGALTSGWALNQTKSAIYLTFAYRTVNRRKTEPRAPDNLCQLVAFANGLDDPHANVASATGILTSNKPMANGAVLYLASNDTIYGTSVAVPPELTAGQPYYVRDANGSTFRLSATPGGAAIAWTADRTDVRFLQDFTDGSADTSAACNPPPSADDGPCMNGAAVVEAYLAGVPGATLALVNKSANFLSLVDTREWKPWSRAVPGGIAWTAPVPAPIPLPPGAVTGIAASNVSYNAMTAGWTAPSSGGPAATYSVRYRPPGGGAWTTVAGISGPTVRLAGLVPATAYEVEVSAVNAGGTGPAATVTLSTIARPTTGYVVDIKAQQSVISDSQGSVHMGIHVTANADDSHPASVLIGLTLSGTQPSNPADTTGGSYNASGWAPCGIINYAGDIYYEIDFRMAGKPGTWTWIVQTPDGVHVAIPGAQQVVVTS